MAGRAKENLSGGSLKYLSVYKKKSAYLNVVTYTIMICAMVKICWGDGHQFNWGLV